MAKYLQLDVKKRVIRAHECWGEGGGVGALIQTELDYKLVR